jgi:hypothetical protein
MNPLQSKIEQTAKEYLTYKSFFEEEVKKMDAKRDEVANKSLSLSGEDLYSYYFDVFAEKELLFKDLLIHRTKLFHELNLVKDLVEVPKEILDLVEGFDVKCNFAILGKDKKILDEKAYNTYKEDYIKGSMLLSKVNEPL